MAPFRRHHVPAEPVDADDQPLVQPVHLTRVELATGLDHRKVFAATRVAEEPHYPGKEARSLLRYLDVADDRPRPVKWWPR
jgi:hypothetical protein